MAYVRIQAPRPAKLTLNKLKDGLYEIEGDSGNVSVCFTRDGVILVDDKYECDFEGIPGAVRGAVKLSGGIRVINVWPSIVDTRFRENALAGKATTPVANIRRLVSVEQVA
jgi:hypothetical protein